MYFLRVFSIFVIVMSSLPVASAQDVQSQPHSIVEINSDITETVETDQDHQLATTSVTQSVVELVTTEPIVVPSNQIEDELFFRDIASFTPLNMFAHGVRWSIDHGLPIETIVLTLMIPVLATLITITRNIIGLPSLDTLVMVSFSIALLASNLVVGLLLLSVIVLSSVLARSMLRKLKIMQQPKITIAMLIVSVVVLFTLSVAAAWNVFNVESISVVPILLLIIMSERIVRLQFESNPTNAWLTVIITLCVGLLGYYLLLSDVVRSVILNYPETILLLVPINIYVGRYFGLRVSEHIRFSDLLKQKNK